MPKRRGVASSKAHGQKKETPSDDAANPMTPEHAVDLICRSFRSNQHWLPSKALAKCLAMPYQRLLVVTAAKDDLSNLVWTSVLVLVYCATHLVDFHESWYEAADASAAWLRQQQHFLDQREDLVRSACSLLNVRYAEQLLTTLFAVTGEGQEEEGVGADDDDAELLSLGWQRCFLDEPPYTAYYWNMETNLSTWRHPLETAQLERELQEQKQQRRDLLARVLLQRLPINRDVMPPAETPVCADCADDGTKRDAQVLCLECDKRYFCESCCDAVHCDRARRSHLERGLRFRECFGIAGFPKSTPKPRTPFMIYQEQQQQQQQEREQPIVLAETLEVHG